ncbi:MAG: transglutaminase domain-containing protein [Pseudomonadota bacterium]
MPAPQVVAALLDGGSIRNGRALPAVESLDILAVDAAMSEFLSERVNAAAPTRERLQQLLDAVIEDPNFALDYQGTTLSAVETFHRGQGNCLAFTTMFIAMARAVGLEAAYQEVQTPPTWDRDNDSIVMTRHINANVTNVNATTRSGSLATWQGQARAGWVVDFNLTEYRSFYRKTVISDQRAFAHYYSNLSAEALLADRPLWALAYARKALDYEPFFAAAWTNLGILYSRASDLQSAKEAYKVSLAFEPENLTTRSNLASVMQKTGDHTAAARLRDEVARYRHENPYYRFELAKSLIRRADYASAQGHLEAAINKQPADERFHLALSAVHTAMGNTRLAKHSLEEAKRLSHDPDAPKRFEQKLRELEKGLEQRPAGSIASL